MGLLKPEQSVCHIARFSASFGTEIQLKWPSDVPSKIPKKGPREDSLQYGERPTSSGCPYSPKQYGGSKERSLIWLKKKQPAIPFELYIT